MARGLRCPGAAYTPGLYRQSKLMGFSGPWDEAGSLHQVSEAVPALLHRSMQRIPTRGFWVSCGYGRTILDYFHLGSQARASCESDTTERPFRAGMSFN